MSRVLIVDDIVENRYLLETILKAGGYDVVSAVNGAEALAAAEAAPPDLLVTDILMPVMDGFELCRRWKADETLRGIPLVFYTATYTDAKDEVLARTLGADLFLVKPMPPDALLEAIGKTLASPRTESPAADAGKALQGYSEALFRKLQRKVGQLEAEVATRKRAEEEVRALNAGLEERVRSRTAELETSIREMEAFSYTVSHDLRAPLRAIDGYAALLDSEAAERLAPESRELLRRIRASARTMSTLIDELLEFSRTGRTELRRTRLDMGEIFRSAFEQLTTPAERERVELRVDALPPADGDPALVRHVVTNLLSNALKFSSGRARPVVEIGSREEGSRVVYFVKDNGAGFDMRYVDKLFGVFQRLHSPAEFPGVGVGLAIVQRIVARHGGTVSASGRIGEGAEFTFSL
ncbi:MAG TPA: response regulator [Thermoanaerobaculia bacterium]|nr:response regulator [Thermoanaerobaculia bacterium]HPA50667.1 response regulator [Thermoanaerobaculia bacterium]HQN07145.1 response regulator [Thermoanaerobaculia bacterium]HQP85700.1 response regulator [Thermoanaerobaculia bacterium]